MKFSICPCTRSSSYLSHPDSSTTNSSSPIFKSTPYRFPPFRVNPLLAHIFYFMSLSLLGFLLLKAFPQRKPSHNFDIFFTSVSASTVSSMSVIEMESFSNLQLLVMTLLMFLGGEIFTSLLVLLKEKLRLRNKDSDESPSITKQIKSTQTTTTTRIEDLEMESPKKDDNGMRYSCITYLTKVITGYLLLVHVIGSSLILLYLRLFNMNVLEKKHISVMVFSIFTTVSSFTNCGYIPTNENMIPFKTNPGLLMLIIPLILGGNTLFPAILRVILRGLKKLPMNKRVVEVDKILEDDHECNIGYDHLLTYQRCVFLVRTVVGFIVVQLIFFCCMEWESEVLKDLNSYQKIVTALFLAVNARHAGESTVDLSLLPHAILVLYVMMMYLPPYTTFIPIAADDESRSQGSNEKKNQRGVLMESLIFSPLSYIVISIILICVTERKHMVEDPLNFNVLNIVVEVISAYGNVGFSTGYSCERRLKKDGECVDKWYGFSGRWSYKGKVILVFVMFFGRLKKFSLRGGKAWYLPPYTTFIPIAADDESRSQGSDEKIKNQRGVLMESLIFSPLSYLVISIILICVTERKHMVEDPLNFNVLNIVVEVISAYGNVGFSTGYSCERRLKKDGECVDKWYGFSGRWSYKGKVILVFVMFFGRLKKFSLRGGKAWKLD